MQCSVWGKYFFKQPMTLACPTPLNCAHLNFSMKSSKSVARRPRPAKFWPAVGFATLAGMRSMSAPAFLSHYLSRQPSSGLAGSSLRLLQKPVTAGLLKAVAAGEIVADKLPGTPDRIALPVLTGRLVRATAARWAVACLGPPWRLPPPS